MATERKAPDVLIVQDNLTGVVADIQDDPDSPDGDWLEAISNNADSVARVSFPTPTGDPTVGADLQEFRALVRKMGGTGTPEARLELWENGALIREGTLEDITTDTVINLTWNANELGTADGSLVECRVYGKKSGGGPSARATIEVGAVEWNVTYTPGVEEHSGSAAITGNGSLTGVAKKGGIQSALISAKGALVAIGLVAMLGITSISGGGAIATIGQKAAQADVAISGGGSIVAIGTKAEGEPHSGSAAISGNGAVAVQGEKGAVDVGAISGGGAILSSGIKAAEGTAEVAGNGSIITSGTKEEPEQYSGSAVISGGGAVASEGEKGAEGSPAVFGNGALASIGKKETEGIGLISGNGLISTVGERWEGVAYYGSAIISGGGELSSAATKLIWATGTQASREEKELVLIDTKELVLIGKKKPIFISKEIK